MSVVLNKFSDSSGFFATEILYDANNKPVANAANAKGTKHEHQIKYFAACKMITQVCDTKLII
jgi:hypothetical protein